MKSKVSFYIIFHLLVTELQSQQLLIPETFQIQGIVKSEIGGLGIPYVHVYVAGSAFGTVTNSEGEYEVKIPYSSSPIKVCVSGVGFQKEIFEVQRQLNQEMNFLLKEAVYELNAVVITGNSVDSASLIYNTAVHFIRFNYPSKSHLIEGFFREVSLKDTAYTRLIEASIRVQEVGYQRNYFSNEGETKNRVKILELRKSDDFKHYDVVDKLFVSAMGEQNELYTIFQKNYVRTISEEIENRILTRRHIALLDKNYEGHTIFDGEKVFVISMQTPPASNFFRHEYVRFFINAADYAIVKIEHLSVPNPSRNEIKPEWLIENKFFSKSEILYRKIGGHYFPTFIHKTESPYDAKAIFKTGKKIEKQYIDVVFLLTNIFDERSLKIKWKEAEDQEKDLYKINKPYNEQFWKNYNAVILNPLTKDRVKDLELKDSINAQFKKNNE